MMMDRENAKENRAWLQVFRGRLRELETRLAENDVQREELKITIEATKRLISDFSILCGETTEQDISFVGITDACRRIIRDSSGGISAVQVRDALLKNGFDLGVYSNPLASIHTILKRLEEKDEARAETRNETTFYFWQPTQPPGIANNAAPFHRKRRRRIDPVRLQSILRGSRIVSAPGSTDSDKSK